jgi:hypothetical protein
MQLDKETMERSLGDDHRAGAQLALLTKVEKVALELFLRDDRGVCRIIVAEPAKLADVFLFGSRPEIFEFDKIPELFDRRIVIKHRAGRMAFCETNFLPESQKQHELAPALPLGAAQFNGWARVGPEQDFDARERAIRKQKLDPHQHRKAMNELFDWYASVPKNQDDEEDSIPSLVELIKRVGTKFTFIFDFGDSWSHTIRVEKIEPALPETTYPRCIDGAGANPLEDCGGAWNLMAVFEAIQNPGRPRNETADRIVKEWVGEGWDFTHFSVEEANQQFRKTFSSSNGQ